MAEEQGKEQEEKAPESENRQGTEVNQAFTTIRNFISTILSIREGTDIDGTIAGIKRDIDFKGPNVWILICSIFIASIGLNVNSTAAIIGAMLISPLMGPILGIGLSVGTNDWQTLVRSLKSFGVAVGVSLLTSFIYFSVTPLVDVQSELLARTTPTFLDALIAIFGGFAGIIAGSRKEKSNVIPGVAIATALMPPLCTAGFGLATGNIKFVLGAFYLFFLNSLFISISTLVVVRYLRFPLRDFVDPIKEKKARSYIILFTVIILVPSGFIFFNVIQESIFARKANQFITENIQFEGTEIFSQKIEYNDTLSKIDLFVMGEPIPLEIEEDLNRRLANYDLKKTVLRIHQANDPEHGNLMGNSAFMEQLYIKTEEQLRDKDQEIQDLKREISNLKLSVPFDSLKKEVGINYDNLERISYANAFESDFKKPTDTIPLFLVRWDEKLSKAKRKREEEKLEAWLKVRLNLDTLKIINY